MRSSKIFNTFSKFLLNKLVPFRFKCSQPLLRLELSNSELFIKTKTLDLQQLSSLVLHSWIFSAKLLSSRLDNTRESNLIFFVEINFTDALHHFFTFFVLFTTFVRSFVPRCITITFGFVSA